MDWNLDFLKNENFRYKTTTLTTNKRLLLLHYHKADIYAAKRICESVCGKVFLPVSSEENQQAAEFLSTNGFDSVWIRASDSYQEGIWKDLETLEDMKFTNWGSGEPNDYGSGEDYAILINNGYWIDISYDGYYEIYYRGYNARILCELPNPAK